MNLIRCISVAAFTSCVALTGLSSPQQVFQAQEKAGEKAPTTPISRPDPDQQMRLLLDQELKAKLNPEVEKLSAEMKQMLDQTEKTREKADNQVSLVANLMEVFLGWLTLVFTVLAAAVSILVWLGVLEIKAVRGLRADVEKEARTALETLEKAKQASTQVMEYRTGLEKAWGDIDAAFNKLPDLEAQGILGPSSYPQVSPENRVMWEDKDLVVIVSDQLKVSSDYEKSSTHFSKLAKYWRRVLDFPRAAARNKRAIELAPENPTAHFSCAQTLVYWAAIDRHNVDVDRDQVNQRLVEALREIEKTIEREERSNVDTLHLRAWIYDELDKLDEAIKWYREAQTQDRKDSTAKGGTENVAINYNLACSLAKAHQFQEACNELKQVVEKDNVWWSRAKVDPDFNGLRKTPEWRKTFPNDTGK